MPWLIITIVSYLILAMVALGDKWFLAGPVVSPKTYIFYIGGLQILVLLLIPFVGFVIPSPFQLFLGLVSGIIFVYGLYWFFKGLQSFEPSRIVPAVGGLVPIFSFLFILILSGGQEMPGLKDLLSFSLLIAGSVALTYEKAKRFSRESIKISVVSAILIAFSFVLTKYVYLAQPFWSGFILTKLGSFLAGLSFLVLFKKEIIAEVFNRKASTGKKTTALFFLNQSAGAGANILQNWGIALVPLAFVPFINALQGVQYVFLFIFSIILSLKFPQLLKEEISRGVILQKVIAILVIGAGLTILALK